MSDPVPTTTGPSVVENTDLEAEKRRADTRKTNAEAAKIEAETKRLALTGWREPAYWAALSPLALALITLLGGWVSGYFSAERTRLQGQTSELQGEKAKLEGEKAKLESDIRQVRTQGKAVADDFAAAVKKLEELADVKQRELERLVSALQQKGINVGAVHQEANAIQMKLKEIQIELANAKKKLAELPTFDPPPRP